MHTPRLHAQTCLVQHTKRTGLESCESPEAVSSNLQSMLLTNPPCSCMACCFANNAPCIHGSHCNVISIFTLQTQNTHPIPKLGPIHNIWSELFPLWLPPSLLWKGEKVWRAKWRRPLGDHRNFDVGPPGGPKVDQRAYSVCEGCIIKLYIL